MGSLCKYKNMIGEPNTGIHSYRLFGVAIIDVLVTIMGGVIFSYFTGYNLLYTLVILFIIGIIAHRVFCVRTAVDKLLFPDKK